MFLAENNVFDLVSLFLTKFGVYALNQSPDCHAIELKKELGKTKVVGQSMLNQPSWHWADKK